MTIYNNAGVASSLVPRVPFSQPLLIGDEIRSRMPTEFSKLQRAMAKYLSGKGMTHVVALTSTHLPRIELLQRWVMDFISRYYQIAIPRDTDLLAYVAYEPNYHKGFHAHVLFHSPGEFKEGKARKIWSRYGGKNKRSMVVQMIDGDIGLFNYISKDLHRPSAEFDVYTRNDYREEQKQQQNGR